MILSASQRGGARQLAAHLLSNENDHVTVHEVRGFASSDLTDAFVETHAISKATKCRQFLFSLSLSPPPEAKVTTETFEAAVRQIEEKLDLNGQPRAIVFHEKKGRRHAHVVWSRIDADTMTAKQMSFYKMKLREVSKSLYREHGWTMPAGLADSQKRDPRNFTLQDWLQAKRSEQDPRDIKEALQDAWQISDGRAAFENALNERGYKLARGDRRGYVAVDFEGNVFSIPRWIGLKTKEVRARLGRSADLPPITDQMTSFKNEIAPVIDGHLLEAKDIRDEDLGEIETKREMLVKAQKQERAALEVRQELRAKEEHAKRLSLYRKGLKGLIDRFTGRHARLKMVNEHDLYRCLNRDQNERDDLIFTHIEARGRLEREKQDTLANYDMVRHALLCETVQSQETIENEAEIQRHLKRHDRENDLGR